jgi:hypothetical protein
LPEERVITSDEADDTAAGLARHLVAFEAEFAAQRPARVVLGDASDAALAAALVATKMLIALEATPAARNATAHNGRLIAQLVPTYTEIA